MIVLNLVLYYLVILPLSWLPFSILYLFSDSLYLCLYRVFGYRKAVVRTNLRNSFPEKSEAELNRLEALFYRHLCDVIVETLKTFSISETEMRKRFIVRNPEVADHFYAQGGSVMLCGGHYNNWEWIAVGLKLHVKHMTYGLYKPLSNPFFNRKIRSSRGRFGMQLVPYKETRSYLEEHRGQPTMTIFAIDQSPSSANRCYWMSFLHQDTGVPFGLEKFAREFDAPVIFCRLDKVKRGHYAVTFELLTDQPSVNPEGWIIESATRKLESIIRAAPQYWLWSHKRWKHKRPAHSNSPSKEMSTE